MPVRELSWTGGCTGYKHARTFSSFSKCHICRCRKGVRRSPWHWQPSHSPFSGALAIQTPSCGADDVTRVQSRRLTLAVNVGKEVHGVLRVERKQFSKWHRNAKGCHSRLGSFWASTTLTLLLIYSQKSWGMTHSSCHFVHLCCLQQAFCQESTPVIRLQVVDE